MRYAKYAASRLNARVKNTLKGVADAFYKRKLRNEGAMERSLDREFGKKSHKWKHPYRVGYPHCSR